MKKQDSSLNPTGSLERLKNKAKVALEKDKERKIDPSSLPRTSHFNNKPESR